MESVMNNLSLEPVFQTLQENVNITLGEFAKVFIEQNDYQMLAKIAEIGEATTAFFNDFSDVIHQEDIDDINMIDETEIVEAEATNTIDECKRTYVRGAYGVDQKFVKDWVYNYLGSRGGMALKSDLFEDFYNQNSHLFNSYDLIVKGNKTMWRQNVTHRIETMRKAKLIVDSKPGAEYNYYILTSSYLARYKNQIKKQLNLFGNEEASVEA